MRRAGLFFGGFLLTCVPLVLMVGVGCSSGGGAQTGTGGTSAGSGGDTGPVGTGGQGGAGPTGTGGGSGGMAVIDGGGSGGASDGTDAPVADTSTDAPDSGDASGASTWTGTWAAAPDGTCGASVGQTLRTIVHTSIGGNAARVRVSNARGNGPLHISNVHLAQRTTGSSIDVATDKALTFAGQPDVTVAAGMFALSDGADFVVKPLSDVAISFFVMASSGGTCQQNPFQTNYAATGNMVSAPTLNGGGGYIYVLGLDVQNPAAEGAVVALGASITTGFRAPGDTNQRWPNLLATKLASANRVIGVLNEGISGEGTSNALARFNRDVLGQTNVKWVIFSDDPINDLGGSTPANDEGQMKMMMMMAHAKGVKFLCSTLTPYLPVEPKRAMVVDFIKSADSGCDGIIDQETATRDPAKQPATWLAKFNSGDSLHPNAAGMQAIADIIDLTVFK
ncbi:MAG TPA: GDSL-type esterase/lipase family protein [Polyangia bacterium]|jgi:lysophospholipase L1-like esterase|nr:GDSL-type esterase/lipase family protein [Polyangia bacterium]